MYDRDGVDAIFDVPTSSAALAIATVAEQNKKLYFNIGAATTELTGAQCNAYTYHYAYDTYMLAHGTGTTLTEQGAKQLVHHLPGLRVRSGHEQELHRGDRGAPAARSARPTRRRSRTTTSRRS